VVHRLIKTYGRFGSVPKDKGTLGRFIRRAAEISSAREIEGDEVEREYDKTRVVEFMSDKLGEEHWGIISNVLDFGIFVMLEESRVEGFVHVSMLGDDYYTLDSTRTQLVGARSAQFYRVGDRVKVSVARVDRDRREIDFTIVATEHREKPEGRDQEFKSAREFARHTRGKTRASRRTGKWSGGTSKRRVGSRKRSVKRAKAKSAPSSTETVKKSPSKRSRRRPRRGGSPRSRKKVDQH
jgi:ribonuclease R